MMEIKNILYILIFCVGLLVYFVKPKWLFLYWLSMQPFILAVYFFFFPAQAGPDLLLHPIYFGYTKPLSYLVVFICILSLVKKKKELLHITVVIPIVLLSLFMVFQFVYKNSTVSGLYGNIKDVIFCSAPCLLLILCPKVRPNRNSVITFICFFVIVQLVFCIMNSFGFRIYSAAFDYSDFSNNLISGTFARYNHMTNYLSSFFLVLLYAYFEDRSINKLLFIITSLIIGTIILFSGSRMSIVLFVFLSLFYVFYHNRKHIVKLSLVVLLLIVIFPLLANNDLFYGQKEDSGTGFERNVLGITNIINSSDLSEGSTIAYSLYLFNYKSTDILFGNGVSYSNHKYYEDNVFTDVGAYKSDARYAFMIVEYGIIGFMLYMMLFYLMFKQLVIRFHKKQLLLYVCLCYYLLFGVTDEGFFDIMQCSIPFIYSSSH